jgi:ubiquinone biosynthesis protein Coq4
MMQPLVASPNPAPRLQLVLNLIVRIAVARGRDVLQIVEIEKLRFLPTGIFGRTWADFLNEHNFQLFTTSSRRKQLHE